MLKTFISILLITFISVAAKAEFSLKVNTRLKTANGYSGWKSLNYIILSGDELNKKTNSNYSRYSVFFMFIDSNNEVCVVELKDVYYYQPWEPLTYEIFLRQANLRGGTKSRLYGTLAANYADIAKGTSFQFCFSEICLND